MHDPHSMPPPWTASPPPSPMNGHPYAPPPTASEFVVAMMLGRIEAASGRQTEILLSVHERLIELPDRIASRLPSALGHPPAPPPAPPSAATMTQRLGTVREWVLAAAALTALAAAVAGKITMLEAADMLRRLTLGP